MIIVYTKPYDGVPMSAPLSYAVIPDPGVTFLFILRKYVAGTWVDAATISIETPPTAIAETGAYRMDCVATTGTVYVPMVAA